jgi:drug/metabolite transporter (DMT)-like permease
LTPPSAQSSAQSGGAAAAHPRGLTLAFALAGVLLIWSTNYIAGKIALAHLPALSIVSFRFEISATVLLGIYFAHRNRAPLRRSDLWTFVYLGFFGFMINQGCFVIGLSHTTSEHSVVIIAMGPIVILLLASALKLEKLTVAKSVGMAISFSGVLLLETEHGSPMHSPLLLGDMITLTGTMGFAMYTVLGKRVAKAYDALTVTTFSCVVAATLFLPVAVHQGAHLDWKNVGWAGWGGLFYMAVASGVAGFLLFYWLLRHMDASRVVAVNYFQPVVVFLLSIPILGEHPTVQLLFSAALVILGVYLTEHISRKERNPATPRPGY